MSNVKIAVYVKFLIRRKKNCIDRLLIDYGTPDIIQRYFPGGWVGNDRDGRPIYILRVGDIDVRGVMKAVHGEDVWIRHVRKMLNYSNEYPINFLLLFSFRYCILLRKG